MRTMLSDGFGRELIGIRVSLTDRCNFDCEYCHNEGLGDTRGPLAPRADEIRTDEVGRVLEVAADLGVEAVKLTGGEPMLREDLEAIVRQAPSELAVSMTTNGVYLPGRAGDLADAGLQRVNVSRDAIDPSTFEDVTNTGASSQVFRGIDAALEAGLHPVKLNAVVYEGTAPHVPDLIEYAAKQGGLVVQLIEFMPELVDTPDWAIDIERVHDWLDEQAFRVDTREMHHRRRYHIAPGENSPDGESLDSAETAVVEIVDPVGNDDFCANCHRVRVTPDGHLMGCLNQPDKRVSLGDCSRDEIRTAFENVVADRVPYYGEYKIKSDTGEWVLNPEYADVPMPRTDD